MASEVGICNNALIKIGEQIVTAIKPPEDSKAARLCSQLYDSTRDAVLRAHPWNFAIKRQSLAENATPPVFQYSHSYDLPSDCLRVLAIQDSGIYTDLEYKIEGRQLVTDEGSVNIVYVSRVEDPNIFDSVFIETLSARLAYELAYPLAESNTLMQNMYSIYKEKLSEARTMDGQEGTPPKLISREWTDSRI